MEYADKRRGTRPLVSIPESQRCLLDREMECGLKPVKLVKTGPLSATANAGQEAEYPVGQELFSLGGEATLAHSKSKIVQVLFNLLDLTLRHYLLH